MSGIIDLIANAKHCDVIRLDQGVELIAAEEPDAWVRVTARDVTIEGQSDPSKPPARVLSRGLAVYAALGWTFRNITFVGEGNGPDDPEVGALLHMVGGSEWTISRCQFHSSRAYGQLSIGDDHGTVPMKWVVEDCAFFDNGATDGSAGPTHTSVQEHAVYVVVGPKRRPMGGTIRRSFFRNMRCGATVKLGGVDAHNGACEGVHVEDASFSGHHDIPVLLASRVDVTLAELTVDGTYDQGSYTVWSDGPVKVTLTDCSLPGEYFQTLPPFWSSYTTWWTRLFRCSPRVRPVGEDSRHRRGYVKWVT